MGGCAITHVAGESAVSRRGEASVHEEAGGWSHAGRVGMLRAKPMPRNDGREMALRGYCLN
ncbi:hypothetical protein PAMC26577_29480 [Caballeronia sordidicola]|uniref:Uncharacterized protein n=1 Tax=Caballeronia sordidicola TaxID=196367 RepID=A0A242MFX0_CABSO|nr:hypothetical protein PAMC26577_29480 [Caballeronia sordidicola]